MNSFRDSKGREWSPSFDGEATVAARVETGICLARMRVSRRPNFPGGADWHAFIAMLWPAIRAQAEALGVDRDEFASGLRESVVIETAVAAVVEALIENAPEGAKVDMREAWTRVALSNIPTRPAPDKAA